MKMSGSTEVLVTYFRKIQLLLWTMINKTENAMPLKIVFMPLKYKIMSL